MVTFNVGGIQSTFVMPLMVTKDKPYLVLDFDDAKRDVELDPALIEKLPEGSTPPYRYKAHVGVKLAK